MTRTCNNSSSKGAVRCAWSAEAVRGCASKVGPSTTEDRERRTTVIPAGWSGGEWGPWVAAGIVMTSHLASGQEALRSSLAGEAAARVSRSQAQSGAYNYKAGDFRLLATPSLGLEWNDNVELGQGAAEDDFILRPALNLSASYPITRRNLLHLTLGVGYNYYFRHDELSRLFLQSGSQIGFDIFIHDFWINLHDRFSYSQDSAQEAAVANTGSYGQFNNTAGISATWNLNDVTLTLGYDHQNNYSTSSQFEQTDRTSELFVARAGFQVHPRLTAGVEGTASITAYDQELLNDSLGYSGGLYAEWSPGPYFSVQPRVGYSIYSFDQTSSVTPAEDMDAWYAGLMVSHAITDYVTYSLSAGRELRLGIQSDAIESWYLRPSATWSIFKDVGITTALFYEHGTQGGGKLPGFPGETYDWYGGNLGFSYAPTKRLRVSLDYRLTLRSSDGESRGYTQNLVGLRATYALQ